MPHRILARLDLPREQSVFDAFLILAQLLSFPIKLDKPILELEIQKKLEGVSLVGQEFQAQYHEHFRIASESCQPLIFVNKQVRENLLSITAAPFLMVKTLLGDLVPFFEEEESVVKHTLDEIFKKDGRIRNDFTIANSHLNLLVDLPPYLARPNEPVALKHLKYRQFSYIEPVWELTAEPAIAHKRYGFTIEKAAPGFDQYASYSQTYGIILNSIIAATNRHVTITLIRHGEQWLLFKSNEVVLFVDIGELLAYLKNTIFLTLSPTDPIYYKFYLERPITRDARQ